MTREREWPKIISNNGVCGEGRNKHGGDLSTANVTKTSDDGI